MEIKEIKVSLKRIVENLVNKNYNAIYEDDYLQEMPASQMEEIILDYGGVFTLPPLISFDKFIIYTISENELTIDFDLWCDNEKSDLTLICRFKDFDNKIRYTIEDMHIL
jgi:hypothetical protein